MNLCLCFVLICYPYSYGKQKIVKTKKRHRKNKGGFIMEYKFTTGDFEKEVLQSDKPVLVDFFADWCGPCKMMAPVVEQLAEELDGKAKVGKLNIDENMEIAEKYGVMNIPTFLVFKDGQEKARIVGAVSKNELKNKLEQTLA
ncbi:MULTISPECIES: thioredoxin [unclassified Eisenbergiella]|uniref:thioredoxin n=1 Tax=unclassified Eisenbergiella TaxID=2652273 RepID=UPI00242F3D20|nr:MULTISPECIES: thioredoxin [unclassified Eisenbergiella]